MPKNNTKVEEYKDSRKTDSIVVLLYPKDNVSMVKSQDQDNPEESEEAVSTNLVSHADATNALELELCYAEQHTPAKPTHEIM
ncbi:hypothetical protein AVEN_190940-1 [Araneus ventricosus]|uniref:Uncharacterized protein n=1 Tax=Araneus ventricosus TaxID=182803 RepID=A0A4Y2JII0_ARAVE|nr:hypothetical protein AVEN_190940-1 [Araneus ventricosus]